MMFNADSHASSAEAIAEALAHELETLTQVVETLDIEHEALMEIGRAHSELQSQDSISFDVLWV